MIDLMGDAVVHARRGARAAYGPIRTPLCAGAAPLDVAAGLMALAPFKHLYVADLDAISGQGGHDQTLAALAAAHPGLALWVDAGEAQAQAVARRAEQGPGRAVVGSETMVDLGSGLSALAAGAVALSLDFGPEGPRGPAAIHHRAELWPESVIVMTLARVGATEGPDFARLADIVARAGGRRVYAAGGVRQADDVERLADMGIAGVLLASALHDGRLSPAEIARFMA
ncbi:nickel transporter [Ancylobacter pratisalsi]|uniref:Nickel transporter n=1 Tax=Ancylobacter pratisalsi TaxID=1745854 RepID=A0A6P1YUI1_9HYPH|nr:nickel transporter [Ancylobacter pratisalsi]